MKMNASEILSDFSLINASDTSILTQFVADHFYEAGSDLIPWIPTDYSLNPTFLKTIKNESWIPWAQDLNGTYISICHPITTRNTILHCLLVLS